MLLKKQSPPNRKKPELKAFAFYSKVAKETGLQISDVDAIYSEFVKDVLEALPQANVLIVRNFGQFEINPRRLRVTFFKRSLYLMDVIKNPEYPKREIRYKRTLSIMKAVLEKMMKSFESCVICNTNEHTSYVCVRNVIGNLYSFVDQLKEIKDPMAEDLIKELTEMYDSYAIRLNKHSDEIGAKEFMEQYKAFILSIRPELSETWGMPKRARRNDPTNSIYLPMDELENLYIPQYDIKYYI